MGKVKFGILGAGRIADSVSQAIAAVEDAELYAVASRSLEKAEEFKARRGVKVAYGSYEQLVNDPEIDVIYIATPHSEHRANAILALNAGKNVLCEKPMAPNAAQAGEIIELASSKKLFLMEAVWMRFLPAVRAALKWVEDGRIGELRLLEAAFCFSVKVDINNRLFNPALAGGALLDVGVYPLNLASLFLGSPSEVMGMATIGSTGVDEQGAALLKYDSGAIANLRFAVGTRAADEAVLYGTKGRVIIPHFWRAPKAELWVDETLIETFDQPFLCNGYEYEIMEVCRCLREGKLGSDIVPTTSTAAILAITDRLRASWGERYPFE